MLITLMKHNYYSETITNIGSHNEYSLDPITLFVIYYFVVILVINLS